MTAKQITEDDTKLVREAILHPYLYSTLELDIRLMMESEMKMGSVYARLLRKVQNQVADTLTETKRNMRQNGIKILEERRETDRIVTLFLCRGYQQEIVMLIKHLKGEVQHMLSQYLQVDENDQRTDP